jgi:LPS export ABC transporter permease LptG/LPS export ABC transporter permease LptF
VIFRLISRYVFREIATGAVLGTVLFTFVFFLQKLGSGNVFALLLRGSAPPETVAYLLGLLFLPTLPFTVPVGVLVGTLIGLSRMSSDNEIVALRAAGVPARTVLTPVLGFATLGIVLTAAASLWLTPWSIRETIRISNAIAATQLTAEIQPRVFEESFPNRILYVGDVIAGPVVQWRQIFMADLRPPTERQSSAKESGDAPPITIAERAIAVSDPARNRIQLTMENGYSHEIGKDPSDDYNIAFPKGDQVLEAQKPEEVRPRRAFTEYDTLPLRRLAPTLPPQESIDARIELYQRFSLPLACVLLALVGLPLGVSSRKGGRSSAFVLTVLLAFAYYVSFLTLTGFARQGRLPAAAAVWIPSLIFGVLGAFLVVRLERTASFDLIDTLRRRFDGLFKRFGTWPGVSAPSAPRIWFLPQVLDSYVLNMFLFYFALLLASFVLMVEIFTFFELLGDIVKNNIPMPRVLRYLLFLAPKLIYDSAPLAVLVAVLVTFGVMTKNNEVTAFKACGVSMYRLAAPVLVAATLMSGALFAFDHYYVPDANRKQDAIRNEIKGKPVQTYLRPDRKWIFGNGSRIYYYKYFEPADNVMLGVSVYDLDPKSFHLKRLIHAERARWEPTLDTWVFQSGQMRAIDGIRVKGFQDFQGGAATFPELNESPAYFRKEVKLSQQMNFLELGEYIRELSQSGLDTIKLQVQQQSKFSIPLFALIMALISVPFAFLTGNRGAMAGVGASLGIAIAYWSVQKLFEQIGFLNQLPPAAAAWAPDALFALAGGYLMLRMRT